MWVVLMSRGTVLLIKKVPNSELKRIIKQNKMMPHSSMPLLKLNCLFSEIASHDISNFLYCCQLQKINKNTDTVKNKKWLDGQRNI